MIEDLKIDRLDFLGVCKSMEAAMKRQPGTHWVTLQFSPAQLRITSKWGNGIVRTTGKTSASGRVAYNYIKRLILAQGLTKLKKDTLAVILAPAHGKLVIEDAALKVDFD